MTAPTPSRAAVFLKALTCAVALLCASCAGMRDPKGSVVRIDREDVRSWNPHDIWLRTATRPDTYVPRGMSKKVPLDEAHGRWIVDPQDGSRFYIPIGGSEMYPHDYIEDQAAIATNRHPTAMLPLIFISQLFSGALAGGLK